MSAQELLLFLSFQCFTFQCSVHGAYVATDDEEQVLPDVGSRLWTKQGQPDHAAMALFQQLNEAREAPLVHTSEPAEFAHCAVAVWFWHVTGEHG